MAWQIRGVTEKITGAERWQISSHPQGEWAAAGQYRDMLEVGEVSLGNAGDYDIGVVRNASSGWGAHRYGDALADFATAIAISPSQQLIMTGHVWGAPDFGVGPLESGTDRMFLAELPLP